MSATSSKEVFMNFEYYTLHALVSEFYLILVLYPSGLHNHFLRFKPRVHMRLVFLTSLCC